MTDVPDKVTGPGENDTTPTPPPRRKRATLLNSKKPQHLDLEKSIDSVISCCNKSQEEGELERLDLARRQGSRSRAFSTTTTPAPPPRRKRRTLLLKKPKRFQLENSVDSIVNGCEKSRAQGEIEHESRLEQLQEYRSRASSTTTTPTPPPRRKRTTLLLKKQQRLELEKSVDSIVSCCNNIEEDAEREHRLGLLQRSRLRASSANDIYKCTSVASTSTCSFDRSMSSMTMDSELESSDIFTEDSTKSSNHVSMTTKSAEGSKFSPMPAPRNENYYSGSELRRQSAPTSSSKTLVISKPSCEGGRSVSLSPGVFGDSEKSPSSLSPIHSPAQKTTRAPPRPSAGPSARPPRPPTLAQGCSNKTAPYSQLYATTDQTSPKKDTLVIDSKSLIVAAGGDKQRTLPRSYGRKCDTPAQRSRNRDDASIVYGKRTQVALNKLVATVKMFNKSSGQSSQKTAQKTQSKIPPKRPPPAVRNTPRPPIPKTGVSCDQSSEENLYVNEYDDHIYMEVGHARYNPTINCYSESSGSGIDDVGGVEDPYVIMNSGNDSHIYTSLDFGTRNESKVYDVVQVGGLGKQCPTPALGASYEPERDNTYVSLDELKRYKVITTLGSDSESKSGAKAGGITYENITYEDRPYETINYENTTSVVRKKTQGNNAGRSPNPTVTSTTRRTLHHQ